MIGGALVVVAALALAAGSAGRGPRAAGRCVLDARADTVLVARHDLARGVVLTAADIDTVVTHDARDPRPATRGPITGWLTRRVIRAGEPLRAPAVAPPPLIRRGARVTVVWETAGLRVTRDGTAVGAAHRGDRVVVRVDGMRRLTGVATDAGIVTVAP